MPTPKQMEKLAAAVVRKSATTPAAQDPALSVEYWNALLNDPRAAANDFRYANGRFQKFRATCCTSSAGAATAQWKSRRLTRSVFTTHRQT
jgi:hypothetical protein